MKRTGSNHSRSTGAPDALDTLNSKTDQHGVLSDVALKLQTAKANCEASRIAYLERTTLLQVLLHLTQPGGAPSDTHAVHDTRRAHAELATRLHVGMSMQRLKLPGGGRGPANDPKLQGSTDHALGVNAQALANHHMSNQSTTAAHRAPDAAVLAAVEEQLAKHAKRVRTALMGGGSSTAAGGAAVAAAQTRDTSAARGAGSSSIDGDDAQASAQACIARVAELAEATARLQQVNAAAALTVRDKLAGYLSLLRDIHDALASILQDNVLTQQVAQDDERCHALVEQVRQLDISTACLSKRLLAQHYDPDQVAVLQRVRGMLLQRTAEQQNEVTALSSKLAAYRHQGEDYERVVQKYGAAREDLVRSEAALQHLQSLNVDLDQLDDD